MGDFDKTQPVSSDKLRVSAPLIRANMDALEDAIGRDHEFPADYGDDAGEHSKVTFNAPISTPTNVANKGFWYIKDVNSVIEAHFLDESGNEIQITSLGSLLGNPLKLTPISSPTDGADKAFVFGKDVGGKIELHFLDEDGNEVQITSAGSINVTIPGAPIPAGTKMWFYADSAPSGWTLDATPSDELLACKGGSTYTTGGTTAGSWTISVSGTGSGSTGTPSSSSVGDAETTPTFALSNHTHTVSTTVSASTSSARMKARVGIICSYDG